ncbi:MAG: type II toxin-antitoxin system VapC family toxin [Bryobacteraceae bacterium]
MIFDTDVLIWAFRGNSAAARAINLERDRSMSVVTLMELLQGARSKLEAQQIQKSLRQLGFRTLHLSQPIGTTATAMVQMYSLSHGIQVTDALIAATALEVGETLCTGNIKHFRVVPGLELAAFKR